MLGAILALLSAATFGLNNAGVRRGVLSGSVLQALAITVPMGVPLFLVVALAAGAEGRLWSLDGTSWAWLSVAGIVHFVFGRYGNYKATQKLGAALSGPIQQLSIPVTLVLAIMFLHESLTPLRLIGIALVMFAPMVILRRRDKREGKRGPSLFKPDYVGGTLWGTVGAIGYGTSPLLIRFGLEGGSVPDSIAGGLISYLAATVVIMLVLLIPANTREIARLERKTAGWFAFSGAAVFLSQLFRYMSLVLAPVSVVAAIQRTSVAFRTVFGWALNREYEIIDGRTLIGIGLSMLGALALTMSTDVVVAYVPLPAWMAAMAQWTWP